MNIKTINKFSYLHLIFAILTISIYCVGYIFKDYAPGGGPEDFTNFIWRNINSFQYDLGNSIINYSKMADANFPGFYIISSLNPFAYSVSSFHLFSFSLGFLTFIIFGLILYEKDNYNNLITNFSISSLILILPFFITRAYWGTSAGLAWFLLVCLVFYLNKIKVLLIKNENITIVHIFIICLLSSLLLYVRASYVFFALYLFLYFLLIIKKNHITLASLIFFSFFSIPGFYLIYIWVNQPLGNINVINVISLKNIFLNFQFLQVILLFIFFLS